MKLSFPEILKNPLSFICLMVLVSYAAVGAEDWEKVPVEDTTWNVPLEPEGSTNKGTDSASVNAGWTTSKLDFLSDSTLAFTVDSLEFEIGDAMDDAKAHTPWDKKVYQLANSLHIKTRSSVIERTLLFERGDSVTLEKLIESERLLREQVFLTEAKILHRYSADGKNILKIKTSDIWSTNPVLSLTKPGDRWLYAFGLVESNFLGYGQKLGVFRAKGSVRTENFLTYEEPLFSLESQPIGVEKLHFYRGL